MTETAPLILFSTVRVHESFRFLSVFECISRAQLYEECITLSSGFRESSRGLPSPFLGNIVKGCITKHANIAADISKRISDLSILMNMNICLCMTWNIEIRKISQKEYEYLAFQYSTSTPEARSYNTEHIFFLSMM